MRVFLGGTCNGSTWRDSLEPLLTIEYFNPVVKEWTEECQAEEIRQREICDYCLYVITPRMKGSYSIAEAVDDSNKRPDKTVFCVLDADYLTETVTTRKDGGVIEMNLSHFDKHQLRALEQVGKMIECNGGKYFTSLDDVARYLNSGRQQWR